MHSLQMQWRKALNSTTDVTGGLVLTNVMMLRNAEGEVTAGMSGLKEDGVLLWGGGDYDEAKIASDNLPVLIKKDGTGRIGGGNFDQKYFYYEDANLGRAVLSAVGRTQMEADFYREFNFANLSFSIVPKYIRVQSVYSVTISTGAIVDKTFRGAFESDNYVDMSVTITNINLIGGKDAFGIGYWNTYSEQCFIYMRVQEFYISQSGSNQSLGECKIVSGNYPEKRSQIIWQDDENGNPVGHTSFTLTLDKKIVFPDGGSQNVYKGNELMVKAKLLLWGYYVTGSASGGYYLPVTNDGQNALYDVDVNIPNLNLHSVSARNYTHITPSSIVMARDARDNKQSEVIFEKLPTSATGLSDGQLYVSQDLNDAFGQLCDVVNACIDVITFASNNTNATLRTQYKNKVSSAKTKVGTQRLIASKKTT